jgi:hypothetical protein
MSDHLQLHRKVYIFFLGFMIFGTLSFVNFKSTNLKEINTVDTDVVFLNKDSKSKLKIAYDDAKTIEIESPLPTHLNHLKETKHKFALILGSYLEISNAKKMKVEMNDRGFKECEVIHNEKTSKFWVTLKFYNNKKDAIYDRERYLLDGWVKQM